MRVAGYHGSLNHKRATLQATRAWLANEEANANTGPGGWVRGPGCTLYRDHKASAARLLKKIQAEEMRGYGEIITR